MKALSIRQPWAWAILHAGKDIENRGWYCRHRGPLLIHAAKGMTRDEWFYGVAAIRQNGRALLEVPRLASLDRGGFVGVCTLADCFTGERDRALGAWWVGPFGFLLRDVRPVPFHPYVGQRGLFEVPNDLATWICTGGAA